MDTRYVLRKHEEKRMTDATEKTYSSLAYSPFTVKQLIKFLLNCSQLGMSLQ